MSEMLSAFFGWRRLEQITRTDSGESPVSAKERKAEDQHMEQSLNHGCSYPNCEADAVSFCGHCDASFCGDHGSKGGDREGDEDGIGGAVPAQCWRHGGFNVDE